MKEFGDFHHFPNMKRFGVQILIRLLKYYILVFLCCLVISMLNISVTTWTPNNHNGILRQSLHGGRSLLDNLVSAKETQNTCGIYLFICGFMLLSTLYRSYHDGKLEGQRKPVHTVGQGSVL